MAHALQKFTGEIIERVGGRHMKHTNPLFAAMLVAAGTVVALPTMLTTPAQAALQYANVCPDTTPQGGTATDCNALIVFGANGAVTTTFGPQTNYDGIEDALVGVVNNSGSSLKSFVLSGAGIYGFDGDGINGFLIPRLLVTPPTPALRHLVLRRTKYVL